MGPEIQAETTLINFTVTMTGLEDQLLNLVVEKERPDLFKLGNDLVKQQNGFVIKMKQLEDDILNKLALSDQFYCCKCKQASFDTFEEAEAHEMQCKIVPKD